MLLKREAELKAKKKKKKPIEKKRKIPKNLVRGASKDPGIYAQALEIVRKREKKKKSRKPPKAIETKFDSTQVRATQSRSRAKAARQALVDKKRKSL